MRREPQAPKPSPPPPLSPVAAAKHPRPTAPEAPNDDPLHIRALLGDAAWLRLHPAVRKRFGNDARLGETHLYRGVMQRVEASALGLIMAQLARLVGAPMAWGTGRDVPCNVVTYDDPVRPGGIVWERHYSFAPRKTQIARTTKVVNESGGLLECFGRGFGMTLKLEEKSGALHFISTSFYLQIFGHRFALPRLLSPGTLEVAHRDAGGGWFQFTLMVCHPLFGRLAFQDGYFQEKEIAHGTRT